MLLGGIFDPAVGWQILVPLVPEVEEHKSKGGWPRTPGGLGGGQQATGGKGSTAGVPCTTTVGEKGINASVS